MRNAVTASFIDKKNLESLVAMTINVWIILQCNTTESKEKHYKQFPFPPEQQ